MLVVQIYVVYSWHDASETSDFLNIVPKDSNSKLAYVTMEATCITVFSGFELRSLLLFVQY